MIPDDVRRFAEAPGAWGELPAESGLTRILTERYCLLLGPVPTFTSVSRLRLDPDEIAEVLGEVREHVTASGHREAIWWIGPSTTPRDAVDRLRAHGLVPDERADSEAHVTSMVLTVEPPLPPPDVVARRVESFDEFFRAGRVGEIAFGLSDEDARAHQAIAAESFARERAGHAARVYAAFLDGQLVGVGRSFVAGDCPAALMVGGAVLPAARSRGVYRALVRARWDDAVAAGMPALVTHAGAMSRPILERLGFHAVAEQEILLDPATA